MISTLLGLLALTSSLTTEEIFRENKLLSHLEALFLDLGAEGISDLPLLPRHSDQFPDDNRAYGVFKFCNPRRLHEFPVPVDPFSFNTNDYTEDELSKIEDVLMLAWMDGYYCGDLFKVGNPGSRLGLRVSNPEWWEWLYHNMSQMEYYIDYYTVFPDELRMFKSFEKAFSHAANNFDNYKKAKAAAEAETGIDEEQSGD